MRLAQLARKLGITQNQIISTLAESGIIINGNGNSKIIEDNIKLIYDHFDYSETEAVEPEEDFEIDEEIKVEPEEQKIQTELPSENLQETLQESIKDISNSPVSKATDTLPLEESSNEHKEETEPQVEVIRAKKIKLEGIKVLGKIELPETPKPKDDGNDEEIKEVSKSKNTRKKVEKSTKRPTHRRREISFEEKQKREKQKQVRKKKKREEELKAKKKKHYYENVQPKTVTKTTKKKAKKKSIQTTSKPIKKIPQTSNPLKKFWLWLNGAYD